MVTVKRLVQRAVQGLGYDVVRRTASHGVADLPYDEDGLLSHHNHDFVGEPSFLAAYERGVIANGFDFHWRWRVHIGLWAAKTAAQLDGDFVECGVNRGFLSSAIMQALDWGGMDRTFWLLDTFAGVDESLLPVDERALVRGRAAQVQSDYYVTGVESVRRNFEQWPSVRVVPGSVPSTLSEVNSSRIAFLHLDMNASTPEVAALRYFWPFLVDGAVVLLDDYAYRGYRPQYEAMNQLAAELGVAIASLPTGQGLLIRPHRGSAGG